MRFTFALQRVLDLKLQFEEQQKIDLKRLIAQRNDIQKQIKELKQRLTSSINNIYSKTRISPQEMILLSEFREHLLQEINLKETELKQLEERIERKKVEVMEAIKERKKLEKLKEKAYLNFLREEKKAEQKEIDEYAIIRKENL